MKLQLNGESIDLQVSNLAELLESQGLGNATVATAVNGVFVPAHSREGSVLNEGDRVEVLAPMQGG